MLHDSEEATTWLRMADPVKNWKDWQLAFDKDILLSGGAVQTVELVEKADDGKLAHDVDDLSTIFEGLVDGADFPLPCDDLEEVAVEEKVSPEWIESLEEDVMNVNELSDAFDALVSEQVEVDEATVDLTEEDEDEEMEDEDSDVESTASANVKIIPSAPVWATLAPLDPRSCIRTPVFKNLDSRIPRIDLPRMDLSFSSNGAAVKAVSAPGISRSVQSMSPKHEKVKVAKYYHDPSTCWICKSSKTPEKKRALHRYHEKRTRRNWKRGPRCRALSFEYPLQWGCANMHLMPSSTFLNDKRKKLLAFKSTTNSNDSTAKSYLEKFSWDLLRAVDEFYANGGESSASGPSKPVSTVSVEAVNSWFNTYVDPDDDEDTINEEGILKFCEDIGVDPQDIVVLVIAWKMGAAYMCAFTRKEWTKGMEVMDCDSIAKLKAKIPKLREAIGSNAEFKKFYSFCFGFSKEPGQKSLSIDIATAMWELLLSTRYDKLTKSWLNFLAEKKPVKGVTRDTWDLLIDFFVKVNDSYDNYDENEAWPVLIDDYMAWIETKK
ncbi:hypothetical protein BBJ29_006417 [Phytophthora kernoviae]|uniref:Defective in cullin neddylation protein n=1 Tax=Phytophthora kernoviae TaxID=325452 RepID=A0A3F2RG37_9STRA|nr:hypothetical protein BBJ29_006417 [Phytophthora kernoviae]RLN56041.1 hypothetical protein BBP00_00008194 [Phytophthora kernoviae]